MEENLQRQLYKELDRLQSVIDVLLEHNAALKKTVYYYEQKLSGTSTDVQPHPLQPMHGMATTPSAYLSTSGGEMILSPPSFSATMEVLAVRTMALQHRREEKTLRTSTLR